jgi:hypothetical protein
MFRPLTVVALSAAALAAAVLGGCSSSSYRAESRVVFTTVAAPVAGQSSDIAIGGSDAAPVGDSPSGGTEPAESRTEQLTGVAAAPDAVDIGSRNGRLTVVVDPGIPGMTITADLRCGGRTMAEARQRLAEATVEVSEPAAGTVRIRPVMPGGWKNGDGASFEVTLPSAASLTARSSNGSIRVEGCRGPIDVDTSNGRLTFVGTEGTITGETSNGRIVLQDTVGSVTARSSNGRVIVDNHLGALSIRTSNGSLDIDLNEASSAPVIARTSNGSVDLSVGRAFGGWIRASTSNGGVSLNGAPELDGPMEMSKRSMAVKLAGDADESRIQSSNGSVRVTVRQ